MRPFRRLRLSTRGEGIDCWRSALSDGLRRLGSASSTWASTTSWTRSTVSSTSRSPPPSSRPCPDGEPLVRLRLPDLPHDRAGELVGVVMGRHANVDDIRRDESHLGMLDRVL